jgi:hypothetical protein
MLLGNQLIGLALPDNTLLILRAEKIGPFKIKDLTITLAILAANQTADPLNERHLEITRVLVGLIIFPGKESVCIYIYTNFF